MEHREELSVAVNYSGVDRLRLYTLLFEEEQDGYIEVVKRSSWGTPEIVYIVE